MCILHLYSIGIPITFIVMGTIYMSGGCLSVFKPSCFNVKPYNSRLNNFIFDKKNDTFNLYGKFKLEHNSLCYIPIDKSVHISNTNIESYKKYHINKTYEILVSKYNNKCFIDSDKSYMSKTLVGFSLIMFGNFIGGLMIYAYCFHNDNKVQAVTVESSEFDQV